MWKSKLRYWLVCGVFFVGVRFSPVASATFQSATMQLSPVYSLQNSVAVVDVAWSFDGEYLASIDQAGQVSIHHSETWDIVASFTCETYNSETLAWSPNQAILALGCAELDTSITSETMGELIVIRFHANNQSPAWSSDGSQIAFPQTNGQIAILNSALETLYLMGAIIVPPNLSTGEMGTPGVLHVNFKWSPTGNHLASLGTAQSEVITIWDLSTQQRILDIEYAVDLTWASDGNTFTVTVLDPGEHIGSLQTWSIAPLEMISSTPIPYDDDAMVVEGVHSDQYMAYCEAGEPLEFYDMLASQEIGLISSEGATIICPINDIAWSTNDMLAIAEQNGEISIWKIKKSSTDE